MFSSILSVVPSETRCGAVTMPRYTHNNCWWNEAKGQVSVIKRVNVLSINKINVKIHAFIFWLHNPVVGFIFLFLHSKHSKNCSFSLFERLFQNRSLSSICVDRQFKIFGDQKVKNPNLMCGSAMSSPTSVYFMLQYFVWPSVYIGAGPWQARTWTWTWSHGHQCHQCQQSEPTVNTDWGKG